MGINVSFKGNVYDENDNIIDCKYQVHYVRQNVWNSVRSTSSGYYSANAGDADSLTQDGSLKANDVVLIAFWQGDGSMVSGDEYNVQLTNTQSNNGITFTDPTPPEDTAIFEFNGKNYDMTLPAEVMYFTVNGVELKIDYAREYTGDPFGVTFNGVFYVGTFAVNEIYSAPTALTVQNISTITNNRDELMDRFGVYAITHDGTTSDYVFNVQIRPKLKPNISWTLPTTGTINRDITAVNNCDDETSWTYGSLTMHHRKTFYGRTVFAMVGLLASTYNWNDNNDTIPGYEASNIHQFTQIGDYIVDLHVVNAWNLKNNAQKSIRLKYNVPIGNMSFTPDGVSTKVHTTEDSTYIANITDEDSRITNVDHKWLIKNRDTNVVISEDLIASNSNLSYQYTKTIAVLQHHYGKQVISWNDGWVDQVLTYTEQLPITNWIPLVNFTDIFLNDTNVRFTPNCSDIDGTIIEYTWKLYALIPFQSGQYTLAKTYVKVDSTPLEVIFDTSGHYKMMLTAKDDYGDTATFYKEFDITGSGGCAAVELAVDDTFFIFPDKVKY